MSLLTLPFSQLGRLHLHIRLLQTSAGLSFTLETLAPSSNAEVQKAESFPGQFVNFRTGHDERGPVLEIFASQDDEVCSDTTNVSPPPSTPTATINSSDMKPLPPSTSPTQTFDVVPAPSLTESFDGILAELDQGLLSSLAPDSNQGFGNFWNEQIADPSLLDSLDFLLPPPQKSNGAFDFGDSLFSDDAWLSNPLSATTSASASSAASTSSSRLSTPELLSDSASAADQQPRKRGDRSDRRRLPCPIPNCGRRFTSQYTLKVHVKAHRPKPKPCFPCTQGCNEQFSRQHDRLRHEVAKHRMVCEWSCPECHRFFSSSKTLGNHKCKAAKNLPGAKWTKPL